MSTRTDDQWLAHKRAVDTERRAQAILRKRHLTRPTPATVARFADTFEGDRVRT